MNSRNKEILVEKNSSNLVVFNEVQLILAEKRTALAALRTGIAVFALPMSLLGLLITTSKYYVISDVLVFLIPLLILCGILSILGAYLIIRSLKRISRYDHIIVKLKRSHPILREIIDEIDFNAEIK